MEQDLAYLFQITSADITNPEIRRLHERVINRTRADFTFTTFVEGNRDETMTEQKAEDIITLIPEGNFRLQATFIKKRNNGEWVIEKGRAPLRASGNRGLVTINKEMNPNTLVGIDMLFYEVSYPVSVVIYEAFELSTPNINNLRPMRHPGNCVAKLVREFFEDSARGGKLTKKRSEDIRRWEKATSKTGGTIENIKKLEGLIKRKIIVKDIMGQCKDCILSASFLSNSNLLTSL